MWSVNIVLFLLLLFFFFESYLFKKRNTWNLFFFQLHLQYILKLKTKEEEEEEGEEEKEILEGKIKMTKI